MQNDSGPVMNRSASRVIRAGSATLLPSSEYLRERVSTARGTGLQKQGQTDQAPDAAPAVTIGGTLERCWTALSRPTTSRLYATPSRPVSRPKTANAGSSASAGVATPDTRKSG